MKETKNRGNIVNAMNMWFEDIPIGAISNLLFLLVEICIIFSFQLLFDSDKY